MLQFAYHNWEGEESFGSHRSNVEKLPEIALPIFPRSCGMFTHHAGFRHFNAGAAKPMVHLLWGLQGEGKLELETRKFSFRRDDFFALPPGTSWLVRCDKGPWSYRWLTFDGPNAATFLESYHIGPNPVAVGSCPTWLFDQFEQYLHLPDVYSWRKMVALICDILAAATKQQTNDEMEFENTAIHLCYARLADANFNVDALARQLHMSRTTIFRAFRRKLNRTPSEFLAELRYTRALELLFRTSLPLREIARRSGFADVTYFNRVVKLRSGLTPGALRAAGEAGIPILSLP